MAIIDRYKSDPSGVFKSQQQNLEKKYTLTDLRNDGVLCFWEHYYVILQSIPLTGQIIDDEYRKLLKI